MGLNVSKTSSIAVVCDLHNRSSHNITEIDFHVSIIGSRPSDLDLRQWYQKPFRQGE